MTFAEGLVPGELSESHVLIGIVRPRPIKGVLRMTIATKLKIDFFFYGQLIDSKGLPTTGIYAFPIVHVTPAVCGRPAHVAAPPVFIVVSCGNGKRSVFFALHT